MYVMMTVDLNKGVTDKQRDTFNEYLKKEKWQRVSLTTTWFANFGEGTTAASAVIATKTYVRKAAATAGIVNYEVAAEAGADRPAVWTHKG